jgi:hypothetical protein
LRSSSANTTRTAPTKRLTGPPARRRLGSWRVANNTPLDPNSVQMDPGYQFAKQQGQQGIDRKVRLLVGASPALR